MRGWAMRGLQYIAVLITMACHPFMINVLTIFPASATFKEKHISITQIVTDSAAWIALKPQRTKEHQTSILGLSLIGVV